MVNRHQREVIHEGLNGVWVHERVMFKLQVALERENWEMGWNTISNFILLTTH